ncbi:FAD-dependent thymidylate synthase [Candidatus Micrarchaeota archaeon]|nr:FAD-dependent thymidylate synthase [Candidatus Micrarchaeota archaeon]
METFTEEERRLLEPFVSNMERPVFVLRNLPEVVKGALFSRYSRSAKSLRRTLLDEFIRNKEIGFDAPSAAGKAGSGAAKSGFEDIVATEKAEQFYDRVLLGYGDDSVAELAGAHIALEDISIIATKVVEDARIGLSPLEKSTRYVYFDQKDEQGRWRYHIEPDLAESEYAGLYRETCDRLFTTYASLIPKVSGYVSERVPRDEKLSDRAYEAVVRSKTCDIIRGLLPASAKTNMGFFGNGRAYEYLITKLYADPLAEMRALAASMQAELRTAIPSFVKRPDTAHGKETQEYIRRTRLDALGAAIPPEAGNEGAVLVDYDGDAEERIAAAALYPYSGQSMSGLLEHVKKMPEAEREGIIAAYVGERANRRHKPGRAFECARYTFDVCANYGCYRDIHRHRVLTQQRQPLGCLHGYTLPKEIADAGCEAEFKDAMDAAKEAWGQIAAKRPLQAQYVVPLAYRIRWQMTMNLREAIHFCELRSQMQGHIDYRRIAQGMFREIERVQPSLARHMKFMDMKEYAFERLEAEKKLDRKIAESMKKHGN